MVLIWGTATILIPAFISFILAAIAFDWDLSTRDDEEIHEETDLFGRKIYKNKTGQIANIKFKKYDDDSKYFTIKVKKSDLSIVSSTYEINEAGYRVNS